MQLKRSKRIEVTVTDSGRETLVLRVLIRQAIPILTSPEAYSSDERRQLAHTLRKALNGEVSEGSLTLSDA